MGAVHQAADAVARFGMAIAADLLTAVLAIAVLKPMRRRYMARA